MLFCPYGWFIKNLTLSCLGELIATYKIDLSGIPNSIFINVLDSLLITELTEK